MSLKKIRDEIDEIDSQIVTLLNKRIQLALDSKKYKPTIVDKNREEQILKNINSNSSEIISSEFYNDLYQLIFKQSKKVQGLD